MIIHASRAASDGSKQAALVLRCPPVESVVLVVFGMCMCVHDMYLCVV